VKSALFGSDLWKPALDKYAEATGLSVELFDIDGRRVLGSTPLTPLVALLREFGFELDLFAECARRCVSQTAHRPAIAADETHGLTVIGTSLVLEREIVGAAVAGYALAGFANVTAVRRWADSSGIPFDRLWGIARRLPPVPERRLMLHGELLQVLGDALLRENYRTRQYEETVIKLQAASAAKDEFLAVLSHELRTPLAAIAGWASVLKKSDSLEPMHRAAGAIERNAFLQSRMVDDLLDMSGIAQGRVTLDLEILELAACVRAALETTAQDMEGKAIHVDFFDAGEPMFIEGDAGRLQQVFRNILSNAAKFTPAGGGIRVSLSRDAGEAVVVIADTGKGIAPEFLPFVFEIFRQQEASKHRAHGGLGIGLSLVKKLTELHRGTVSVASAGAGRGTEVTVRLPLAAEIPDLDEAAQPSAAALAGLSVLVVEDSEDARESLRALLQLCGAKVSLARDGREALDAMTQGAMPDVVLCDLLMPRMDGFEFIRELDLGASSVHPPVIAVSGLASEASRRRTLAAGFEGHVKKPYDEADIVAAVGAAFRHRREKEIAAANGSR
jgi:signal transduction histidine kinase/CheY-like chemotaxis protein